MFIWPGNYINGVLDIASYPGSSPAEKWGEEPGYEAILDIDRACVCTYLYSKLKLINE